MKSIILSALVALMVLAAPVFADVAVGEVGASASPGDQAPRICITHRDIIIGTEANPPGINWFDYRSNLYAFTGEQIEYTVVVRDSNGALDIGNLEVRVDGSPEVLCTEITYSGTGDPSTVYNSIMDGADRLVGTQNPDGGWPWYASGGPSTTNTLGVTAQGVLDAYKLNPKSIYRTSLENAYNYALTKVPVYSGTNETVEGVDSCPDFTFLIEMSEVTGDSKYAELAKQRYDNKKTVYGSARAWAEFIRDARISQGHDNGIIPWDIDKCVKAAVAMDRYFPGQGYDQDANDMTEVIYNLMYTGTPVFDPNDGTEWFYILGLGGALNSFRITKLHLDKASEIKTILLNYQNTDGSWPWNDNYPDGDVQTTAYTVMEILKTGKILEGQSGAIWLLGKQLPTNGWNDPEITEVTSEVVQALFDLYNIIGTCDGMGEFNLATDKIYNCLLSVESQWIGDTEVVLAAYNSAGQSTEATHSENWFFNPAISIDVSTSDGLPIHFEEMPYGADTPEERTVHSLNKIKVKNTAEGGVNLWMFVAGTDLYDPSGASSCWSDKLGQATNYIAIEEYMWYRGWSGTQWTSWEGWTQMSKYDQNAECTIYSCYGGSPVPASEGYDIDPYNQNPLDHVLTNQGTLEIEFKLQYPMPCIGTFSQGSIYIFGKAV